jgi:hypothetical protein
MTLLKKILIVLILVSSLLSCEDSDNNPAYSSGVIEAESGKLMTDIRGDIEEDDVVFEGDFSSFAGIVTATTRNGTDFVVITLRSPVVGEYDLATNLSSSVVLTYDGKSYKNEGGVINFTELDNDVFKGTISSIELNSTSGEGSVTMQNVSFSLED